MLISFSGCRKKEKVNYTHFHKNRKYSSMVDLVCNFFLDIVNVDNFQHSLKIFFRLEVCIVCGVPSSMAEIEGGRVYFLISHIYSRTYPKMQYGQKLHFCEENRWWEGPESIFCDYPSFLYREIWKFEIRWVSQKKC